MIKEWRIEGDEYVWTGKVIKPSMYSPNWLCEGDDPVVFVMEDPDNEYDTAPQNAPTTHEVCLRSDKTP